jgi:hypothetical protein
MLGEIKPQLNFALFRLESYEFNKYKQNNIEKKNKILTYFNCIEGNIGV